MSHVGRLLVATPLIGDPNFERTVVLLVAHGPDGAFGVVINRPSDLPVAEVLPSWVDTVSAPGVLFVGGPVGGEAVIGLGRCAPGPRPADRDTGFSPVVGDYGTVDLHRPPPPGVEGYLSVRLFAGSAGWAPGQLEDELADGAWWAVDAEAGDLTTSDPAGLWRRVLRRQPGEVAWFANHPQDPSDN